MFWGHLSLLGSCYSPLKIVGWRKQNGCHPIYISSERIFHENKNFILMNINLLCKKDLGQKFKSEELWLKSWFLKMFKYWANSRITFISANIKNYFWLFLFKLYLQIHMIIHTNFYSVCTFLWAAMEENVLKNCSYRP